LFLFLFFFAVPIINSKRVAEIRRHKVAAEGNEDSVDKYLHPDKNNCNRLLSIMPRIGGGLQPTGKFHIRQEKFG
jgi:hypothetical protein